MLSTNHIQVTCKQFEKQWSKHKVSTSANQKQKIYVFLSTTNKSCDIMRITTNKKSTNNCFLNG